MRVFISHSTRDHTFIASLRVALTGAGFEPWTAEAEIRPSENFVAKLEEALRSADIGLLIWSRAAESSRWTESEWTSILDRQISEWRTRLAVVLLEPHPLPELLRTSHRIDATSDQESAVHKIIEWLHYRSGILRHAEANRTIFLPGCRPQGFVGRVALLERLRLQFKSPAVTLLSGQPGIGKTLLAPKFAWDTLNDFDATVFQSCGQLTVSQIGNELAEKLPVNSSSVSPLAKLEVAKDWLRRRRSLLILDDIRMNDVERLLPGEPVSVLCTSRFRSLQGVPPNCEIPLDCFSDAEAESVFAFYLGTPASTDDREALLGFAERVGRLPLAVCVGAELVRRTTTPLGKAAAGIRLNELGQATRGRNVGCITRRSYTRMLNRGATSAGRMRNKLRERVLDAAGHKHF